jgi:hypothetical protein
MPQYQDFGSQPPPRLEAVAQHAMKRKATAIMRRSCSDSLLTASQDDGFSEATGLISDEEWLKIKDLAPARDDGAPDSALLPTTIAASAADHPAFDQARYRVW